MTRPLTNMLRELLAVDTSDEDARIEEIRGRVETLIDEPAAKSSRTGRRGRAGRWPAVLHLRRGVVVAGIGLAVLAGVAVAADQGILFSDKSTVDRLQVLGDEAPEESRVPRAATADYTVEHWPVPEGTAGQVEDDRTRVLVEHADPARVVRMVAAPTTNGHLCYALSSGTTSSKLDFNAQSCGGFRQGWPLIESTSLVEGRVLAYYGVAADEVKTVYFVSEGTRMAATMGHNGYVWIPSDGRAPSAVEVELSDGSVARRGLNADPRDDPYQSPRVIRNGRGEG